VRLVVSGERRTAVACLRTDSGHMTFILHVISLALFALWLVIQGVVNCTLIKTSR
jgi:hypothetical protein